MTLLEQHEEHNDKKAFVFSFYSLIVKLARFGFDRY